MTNEAELRTALQSSPNFRTLVFSPKDTRTQAELLALFASADVVVGPHGAGLTNTVISWPGVGVVEFVPQHGLTNLVYLQMGLLLGHRWEGFCPVGSDYGGEIAGVDVKRVVKVVAASAGVQ